MIRKIITTAASRLLIALVNLAIVWLAARVLGAEGMGTISLIILGISINQMVSALVGGSALVYLIPRYPALQLLVPSWIWSVVVSASGSFILGLTGLVPLEFVVDLFWISLLQSLYNINQNVLLGREKITAFNVLAFLQVAVVLITLALMLLVADQASVHSYVIALYVSYASVLMGGSLLVARFVSRGKWWNPVVFRETFRFGGYLQAASFLQLFNYRLSYYIIEKYFDRATLGVFSIGVQISESVWIISKSIAMVQYARISNSSDSLYARDITSLFIRITGLLTVAMLTVLLLLPPEFFVFVFRNDFSNLHPVILSLSPGIFAVAISLMLSHYFSGSGMPWHNTISSGAGLIFTVILGFTLIPRYGLTGAGMVASVAYTAGMIYQLLVYLRISGARWRDLGIRMSDFRALKSHFQQ
jgi:O-antigen/teichoic acid export membrane protein